MGLHFCNRWTLVVIPYGLRTLFYVTGHGQCTALEQCTCDDGWSSENCGTANCTGLNDCSNQGECVAPDSCYCYDGFDGSDCSQPQGDDLNAPVFNASHYYCTVSEKAKTGTSLLDVYATDADQGKNGAIHYELVPYGAEIVATSYLVIDSVSGRVTLLSPIARNLLTTDTLLVWVKAVDGGVPPKEAQAQLHIRVIDVNDHCPEFHSPDSGSMHFVNMSSEINTTVVVIVVTDDDFGDNGEFTISFAASTASVVRDNFEVNATSGRISSLVSPLTVGSFPVVIVATDGASNPCSKQLSITIQVLPPDVEPPKPTSTPAPTTIEMTTATSSPISANIALNTHNVTYSTGYSMSLTLEHTTTGQTDGDRASTTTTAEIRKSPSTAPIRTAETTPQQPSGHSEVTTATSSPISANISPHMNNVTYSTGYSMSSTLEHATTGQTDGDRASTTTTTTAETRKSHSTAPIGTAETTPQQPSGDSEVTTGTLSPISANISLDTNNVTYSMSSTLEHATTTQTDGDRASTTTTTTTTTTAETRKSHSTAPTETAETTPQQPSGDSEVAAYTDTSYIIMGSVLGAVVLAGGLAIGVLIFKVVVMKAQMAKCAVEARNPLSQGYTHSVRVTPTCLSGERWSRGRPPHRQSKGRWFNPTYPRFET